MSSVHVAGDMLEWKYRGKIERYTYILPAGEWLLVPRRAEEDSPKDNRNENREGCDCHIQQTVQHAEDPRPAVEENRMTRSYIVGCMDGGEQHVEASAPVSQPSEVAEGVTNRGGVIVGAIPAPEDEDGGENVQRDQTAKTSEDGGG